MKQSTKAAISKWNYPLMPQYTKYYLLLGMFFHALFYVVLVYGFDYTDSWILRIINILLYVIIYRYSEKMVKQCSFLLTIIIWLVIPFYGSIMLMWQGYQGIWLITFVLLLMIFGFFIKPLLSLPGYFLAYGIAYGLSIRLGFLSLSIDDVLVYGLVGILALMMTIIIRMQLMTDMNRQMHQQQHVEKLNETFSSLIYISSELSMYDDLETIYHMLIDRLVYMYPNASMALMITKGEDHQMLTEIYHEISIQDQRAIKTNFSQFIDTFTMMAGTEFIEAFNQHQEVFKDWMVFNKSFDMRNIEGKTTYDVSLFVKNLDINDYEHNILQIFMEQFKGSIRTKFQAYELEKYATTDPLTGLLNRNAYNEDFQNIVTGYNPSSPFSVLFGDVNSLKYINDTYGHKDGDLVIKTCSKILLETLPQNAKAYRIGGDEMVVLLKDTTLEVAKGLIKQLDEAFSDQTIICTDEVTHEQKVEHVSMCFGAACTNETEFDELMDLADYRMMVHKEAHYIRQGNKRYR